MNRQGIAFQQGGEDGVVPGKPLVIRQNHFTAVGLAVNVDQEDFLVMKPGKPGGERD